MVLGCPKQTPQGLGTVTGDTHSADLTPSTNTLGNGAGTNSNSIFLTTNALGTDTVIASKTVTTTSTTSHVLVVVAFMIGSVGAPMTLKVKRGSTVLASGTATAAWNVFIVDDTTFTPGSTQYDAVYNDTSGTGRVSVSISAHMISLGGSSGTCA